MTCGVNRSGVAFATDFISFSGAFVADTISNGIYSQACHTLQEGLADTCCVHFLIFLVTKSHFFVLCVGESI
jgi:hypothetical protein